MSHEGTAGGHRRARSDVSEATCQPGAQRQARASPTSTRQAVLTALDVLGYDRPSRLRRKSAGLVGLIVPELTNPIFPAFAQIIETALARHGYTPVLCTQTPGGVHEDDYVQMLLDRGVAGIIFVSGLHADTTTDPDRYVTLRDRGLPIVLVNGYIEGVDAPFISNDDVASMELALAHLRAARAHQRSGWPSGPTATCRSSARSPGFRHAMHDDARPRRRRGPHRAHAVHRRGRCGGGQPADRQGCTAIVCGSDLMALGAIRAARQRGLRGAARLVRGRLRRLDAHRVHRPAADDGAAERAGDGGGGRARAARRDRRASLRPARSTSSGPSWSSAARPAPCRTPPRPRVASHVPCAHRWSRGRTRAAVRDGRGRTACRPSEAGPRRTAAGCATTSATSSTR